MYHPVDENALEDLHEFVEIYNAESQTVSLAGWRLAGGIGFEFPAGSSIAPGGYLVIAKDRQRLLAVTAYGLSPASVLGDYDRTLDNGGEKVALIGAQGQGIDSMSYQDEFPWPEAADALGADEEWLAPALLPLSKHQYRGVSLERVSFDFPAGLLYNWAPSPVDGATPGRANSAARSVPLPVVVSLAAVPAGGPGPLIRRTDQVQIRARFDPPQSVGQVFLDYFVDDVASTGEAVVSVSMADDGASGGDPSAGDDEYSVILPQRGDNTLVRYRIRADRGGGLEVVSPRPSDPHPWHLYFVSPVINTRTPVYQLLISPANWTTMWNNIQGGRVSGCTARDAWDAMVPAVFIHQGAARDVFVRYQGSRYNRTNGRDISNWPYPGPSAPSPLRALSWRISLPRHSQLDGRTELTLNKLIQSCPGYNSGVGFRLYQAAGIPSPLVRYVRLHINGGYYHYMLDIERPGDDMIQRYNRERAAAQPDLPREPIGHLFKSEGCNCDEGPFGWGDERPLGASCGYSADDRYRYTYDRKTHGWDTHDELRSLLEDMNALRGDVDALRAFFEERFDLDLLLNYLAIMNWSVPFDDMFQNHFLYQRVSDGKWLVTPWDVDLNFGGWKGASASLYIGEQGDVDNRSGWWNYLKDTFLKSYRSEFDDRLLFLTNTLLLPAEVSKMVDEFAAEANPTEAAQAPAGVACSFAGGITAFKSFASARFQVVNQQLSQVLVDAGPDQTVFIGATVQFDARNSRPDPGPGVVYSWSNGLAGEAPTIVYGQAGTYQVTLTITASGQSFQDSVTITVVAPPSSAYAEANGMVVIEAEHFYLNDRHGAAGAWWAEETASAGFSGPGYMRAADNGYVKFLTDYAGTSPELRYAIRFEGTGLYRVWIRALSSSSDYDSCHVGLDGLARDESYAQRFTVGDYLWSGITRGQGLQTVNVSAPGIHFLSIWIRESGQIVDKVLLAKDQGFTPTGGGPAESELVDVSVKEPFIRGDANHDGALDLSDPLAVLFHLFAGGSRLKCEDYADANDSGALNVSDATFLLLYLFRSGSAPAAPFPAPGFDPTADQYPCGDS
jgi:hypothetical protein